MTIQTTIHIADTDDSVVITPGKVELWDGGSSGHAAIYFPDYYVYTVIPYDEDRQGCGLKDLGAAAAADDLAGWTTEWYRGNPDDRNYTPAGYQKSEAAYILSAGATDGICARLPPVPPFLYNCRQYEGKKRDGKCFTKWK